MSARILSEGRPRASRPKAGLWRPFRGPARGTDPGACPKTSLGLVLDRIRKPVRGPAATKGIPQTPPPIPAITRPHSPPPSQSRRAPGSGPESIQSGSRGGAGPRTGPGARGPDGGPGLGAQAIGPRPAAWAPYSLSQSFLQDDSLHTGQVDHAALWAPAYDRDCKLPPGWHPEPRPAKDDNRKPF